MPFEYNKRNTPNAKTLRKNMTPEEKELWYKFLKTLPYTINRQKTIGQYIVDFYCHSALLVIELDGSQHYEPKAKQEDIQRDEYFKTLGIEVLRYTNIDIHNKFAGVCWDIRRKIEARLKVGTTAK